MPQAVLAIGLAEHYRGQFGPARDAYAAAIAEASATAAYDIVYVSVGNSATQPYVTPFNGYSF